MKVVVEITRWPDKHRSAEGKVVEVLGWADAPGIDVLSIMRRYDLVQEFPPEAQAEARQIPQSVLPEEYAEPGRIDRRHFSAITIDGDDSKDFDDAVYAERRPKSEGGGFFNLFGIADDIAAVGVLEMDRRFVDNEAACIVSGFATKG